jgi:hypothetical protein
MNWSDGWSRPTRIVVTLFAMATIVGIKGGYPLVPTAGPDDVAVGLRKIRRRRLMMYIF